MLKKPELSSSAGTFRKRGDPWVTQREGQSKFGRNLATENADRDGHEQRLSSGFWDKKLADALREESEINKRTHVEPPATGDYQTRMTNIMRVKNEKIAKRHKVVVVKPRAIKPIVD